MERSGRARGRSPGLPDRSPLGPSQAFRPVDLPNFVPGHSGGGRAGVPPASLVASAFPDDVEKSLALTAFAGQAKLAEPERPLAQAAQYVEPKRFSRRFQSTQGAALLFRQLAGLGHGSPCSLKNPRHRARVARDSSGCPPLRKNSCNPSRPYTRTSQRTSASLPRSSTRAKTYPRSRFKSMDAGSTSQNNQLRSAGTPI